MARGVAPGMKPWALIPVKPFGVAKTRLADRLDAAARSRLGRAITLHTAAAAAAAGAVPVIVTGDDGVAAWAGAHGIASVREPPGGGLDGAARSGTAAAPGRCAVVHADLPLLTPGDVTAVVAGDGVAIAPSRDGGTSALAGTGPGFGYAYGPGSFHRHLARSPGARVVIRPGLAFDLDTPADLDLIRSHPDAAWLRPHLA